MERILAVWDGKDEHNPVIVTIASENSYRYFVGNNRYVWILNRETILFDVLKEPGIDIPVFVEGFFAGAECVFRIVMRKES